MAVKKKVPENNVPRGCTFQDQGTGCRCGKAVEGNKSHCCDHESFGPVGLSLMRSHTFATARSTYRGGLG